MGTKNPLIPRPGQSIRVTHECWWSNPTTEHPATIHNAPTVVDHVTDMGGITGSYRVSVTRCDGTPMQVVLDEQGRDVDEVQAAKGRRFVEPVWIEDECEHADVRQIDEHDVECLDCGLVSA